MVTRLFLSVVFVFALLPLSAEASIVIGFSDKADWTGVKFTPGETGANLIGTVGNDASLAVSVMSDLSMLAQGSNTLNNSSGTSNPLYNTNLMITPDSFVGFRDFQQNLDFNSVDQIVKVTVFYTDSDGLNPMSTFENVNFADAPNNSDRYDVFTDAGEIITKIQLESVAGTIVGSSKQIRISPDSVVRVPEPSSLVMFATLLGYCGLRRRHHR